MNLEDSELIWLVNIGEPLPSDGNRMHRMCSWKFELELLGYKVDFFTTDFEHQRKLWIIDFPPGFIKLKSFVSYQSNVSILRLLNHFLISFSALVAFYRHKKKPKVIIVSFPTIWLSFVTVIYARLKGIKVIVDVRDKWPDIFIGNNIFIVVVWPLYLLKWFVFKYASLIVAISPGYLSWAAPNLGEEANFILPLFLKKSPMVSRKISNVDELKFVFSGSLGNTYDFEKLIQLYDLLEMSDITFRIDICGDGPMKNWLLANKGARKSFYIHGWLNDLELQSFLNGAHFGLMYYKPDSPQGLPNKFVEYLANGLPILNTLKGESYDLIQSQQFGFNINDSNFDDFIRWLRVLIDNPDEYSLMCHKNRSFFISNYEQKLVTSKLLKLF